MYAIRRHKYGGVEVLRLETVECPVPGEREVLIKVRAASVNPLDWHFMTGTPYVLRMASGVTVPKDPRLGVDVSGVVEAVGRQVSKFKPGDAVFGCCRGAFAEYACATETLLVAKPENICFDSAAAVPVAAVTALQGLRDLGRLSSGM